MMEQDEQPRKIVYFLFINSKSGGEKGKKYLTIANRKLSFEYTNHTLITVYFVDLFNPQERDKAVQKLGRFVAKAEKGENRQVKVVICGGDGTVIWVVELIAKSGVNTDSIVFCIIPIGTGNDFSRCLGWGGSPISFSAGHINALKARIIDWLAGEESWYDIWNVELDTYEDGTIYQVRNKQEVDTETKLLNRGFCNYFGVGIDARICYSVELRRQKNKWLNLALYACIGCCKLFKKIQPTNQAIDQFKAGQLTEEHEEEEKEPNLKQSKISDMLVKGNAVQLKEGYGSILALNSVRYMAGLKNVWDTNKLGVVKAPPEPFTAQKFDDGKIQFMAFKNELSLGLERFMHSGARVSQGEGPFSFTFRRTEDNTPTFIQIDGQAMKVRQLKSVVIKKNELVKSSRIRVLVKRREE